MSTLGPRTALKSRKISGSLAYILAQTNVKQGTKAATNDVAGCTLEMGADGKWVGTLGSLPKATADALYASGALANLATGTTYRDTNGTQYTYSAGAGWEQHNMDYSLELSLGEDILPSLGILVDDAFITDDGVVTPYSGYAIMQGLHVRPGDSFLIGANGGYANRGGWYLGDVWVKAINNPAPHGNAYGCVAPDGVDNLRICIPKTNRGACFIYDYSEIAMKKGIASISAIGTSITYGYNQYNTSNSVITYWEIAGKNAGVPLENLHNYGVPGAKAADLIGTLSSVIKSDVVSLEIGYNDWAQNYPIGTISDTSSGSFYGALDIIVNFLLEEMPCSKILFCTPPRPLSWSIDNSGSLKIAAYADAVISVARKYGIRVCDFYYNASTATYRQLILLQDGVHPTQIGHTVMSDIWGKAII